MPDSKTTLLTQLRGLQDKLKEQERMIETSVDDVENGKSCRDSKRKEIFLQEAKQILSSKVSQSNKFSLDPVHHLPNYVVHVFQ